MKTRTLLHQIMIESVNIERKIVFFDAITKYLLGKVSNNEKRLGPVQFYWKLMKINFEFEPEIKLFPIIDQKKSLLIQTRTFFGKHICILMLLRYFR